jgi:hypothetical protein
MQASSFGRYGDPLSSYALGSGDRIRYYEVMVRLPGIKHEAEKGNKTCVWRRWCNRADVLTRDTQYHNESVLKKYGPKLKVGDLKEEAKL